MDAMPGGEATSVLGQGSLLKWGSLLGLGVPAGVEAVLGWGGYHQGRGNAGVEGHFWSGGVTSRIGVSLLEWRSLLGRGSWLGWGIVGVWGGDNS